MVADTGSSNERPAAVRLTDGSVLAVFHSTHRGGQVRVSGSTALSSVAATIGFIAHEVEQVIPEAVQRPQARPGEAR
jgi:hypothetical protein